MRIAFIGLGNMGGSMALNLMKAGHTLVVHDMQEGSGGAAHRAGRQVGGGACARPPARAS